MFFTEILQVNLFSFSFMKKPPFLIFKQMLFYVIAKAEDFVYSKLWILTPEYQVISMSFRHRLKISLQTNSLFITRIADSYGSRFTC